MVLSQPHLAGGRLDLQLFLFQSPLECFPHERLFQQTGCFQNQKAAVGLMQGTATDLPVAGHHSAHLGVVFDAAKQVAIGGWVSKTTGALSLACLSLPVWLTTTLGAYISRSRLRLATSSLNSIPRSSARCSTMVLCRSFSWPPDSQPYHHSDHSSFAEA